MLATQVSRETKREMGLQNMHDGEFWIEFFTDFCREFEVKSPHLAAKSKRLRMA